MVHGSAEWRPFEILSAEEAQDWEHLIEQLIECLAKKA